MMSKILMMSNDVDDVVDADVVVGLSSAVVMHACPQSARAEKSTKVGELQWHHNNKNAVPIAPAALPAARPAARPAPAAPPTPPKSSSDGTRARASSHPHTHEPPHACALAHTHQPLELVATRLGQQSTVEHEQHAVRVLAGADDGVAAVERLNVGLAQQLRERVP